MTMRYSPAVLFLTLIAIICSCSAAIFAQGTLADYERARELQSKFQVGVINLPGPVTWIPATDHFWYRRTVTGGGEIVWVDAVSLTRRPAFDHEKLAAALSAVAGQTYTALKLPIAGMGANLTFVDSEQAIEFNANEGHWRCDIINYKCSKLRPAPGLPGGGNTPAQLRPPVTRPPEQPRTSPDGN